MGNNEPESNLLDPDVGALYQLQDALCHLAEEADAQREYLLRHGYGDCLDELALDLAAWYEPGKNWEFHKLLTEGQLAAVGILDAQLAQMSEAEARHLWRSAALNEPAWVEVRRLAREALHTFGFEWHSGLRLQLMERWPSSWWHDL
jgi:hypothetical protein